MTTPLVPSVQAVLELFKGPLAEVRFADIDAAALASLASAAEALAGEVDIQEVKLAELRQQLAERQEALLGLTQRALAYARIYAENDSALLEKLNQIALPRAAKRKSPAPHAELASVPPSAAEADTHGNQHAQDVTATNHVEQSDALDEQTVAASEPNHESPTFSRKSKRRDKSALVTAER